MKGLFFSKGSIIRDYCLSNTPSSFFSSTVKPAFFASDIDKGLRIFGVLTRLMIFLTGFLQSGQTSKAGLSTGRRSSKPSLHLRQHLSDPSSACVMYSYSGICIHVRARHKYTQVRNHLTCVKICDSQHR